MSVRHALLALLSEGPKYGLQLREEFEARTGEVWPLNVGQVYTTCNGSSETAWSSRTVTTTARRRGSRLRPAGPRNWPPGCARHPTWLPRRATSW